MRSVLLFVLVFGSAAACAAEEQAWLFEGTVNRVERDPPSAFFQVGDPVEILVSLDDVREVSRGFGLSFEFFGGNEVRVDGRQLSVTEFIVLDGNQSRTNLEFSALGSNGPFFMNLGVEDGPADQTLDRFPTAEDFDLDRFNFAFGGIELFGITGITQIDFQVDSFRVVPEPGASTVLLTGLFAGLFFRMRRVVSGERTS